MARYNRFSRAGQAPLGPLRIAVDISSDDHRSGTVCVGTGHEGSPSTRDNLGEGHWAEMWPQLPKR